MSLLLRIEVLAHRVCLSTGGHQFGFLIFEGREKARNLFVQVCNNLVLGFLGLLIPQEVALQLLDPLGEFVKLHDQCMVIFLQTFVHFIEGFILMVLLPLFAPPYLLALLILLHDFIPLISEPLNFNVKILYIPIELVNQLVLLSHLITRHATSQLLLLLVRSQAKR